MKGKFAFGEIGEKVLNEVPLTDNTPFELAFKTLSLLNVISLVKTKYLSSNEEERDASRSFSKSYTEEMTYGFSFVPAFPFGKMGERSM